MTITAAAVRFMAEKGLSAIDIAEIMEAMTPARNANAERQARYRDRRDVSVSEWDILRFEIFERDGFTCQYCGATDDLACDHIVPLILGGRSTPDNLTTACRPCNGGKSGMSLEEWQS